MPSRRLLCGLAVNPQNGRSRSDYPGRHSHDRRLAERGECPGAHPVSWHEGGANPTVAMLRMHNGDTGFGTALDLYRAEIHWSLGVQPSKPKKWRETPLLLAPRRHSEIVRRVRPNTVQPRHGAGRFDDPCERAH